MLVQIERLAQELSKLTTMLRSAEVQDAEMKSEIAVARRCATDSAAVRGADLHHNADSVSNGVNACA